MECKTIKSFSKKNKPIFDWKVKHETLQEAQKEADRINAKKDIFIKRVSYECSKCGFFHVGTSFEMLENKKLSMGWLNKIPRLVDKIDLSQFDKKPKTPKPKTYSDKIKGLGQFMLPNKGLFSYCTEDNYVLITLPDESVDCVLITKILDKNRTVLTMNQVKKYIKNKIKNGNI